MAVYRSEAEPLALNLSVTNVAAVLGAVKVKVKLPLSGFTMEIVVSSLILTGLI
jgi:hypothetical protein